MVESFLHSCGSAAGHEMVGILNSQGQLSSASFSIETIDDRALAAAPPHREFRHAVGNQNALGGANPVAMMDVFSTAATH
jgi:hypothetical protein